MFRKLTTRDLINVGIFTLIYLAVFAVIDLIGVGGVYLMFIGWFLPILLNGIVVILYISRVPKIGAMTILSFFMGLGFGFAYGLYTFIGSVILGFIADVVATNAGKETKLQPGRAILGYAILSMITALPIASVLWHSDIYFNAVSSSVDEQFSNQLRELLSPVVVLGAIAALFVVALIGGWIGVKAWRKHFRRAGLAG